MSKYFGFSFPLPGWGNDYPATDGNDYENPIKDYIDDRILDVITDNEQKIIFAYVKQNTATVQDNIFDYSLDGVDSKFNCNYILFE